MSSSGKPSVRLRGILERDGTTLVPFGVLPIHAQMAETLGFEAFWLSGGMSAWWVAGVADVGWLTMTEVVRHSAAVARAVDIPIFCDADTGYGGPVNVQRTVQEFIRAGVAGIHIEDQLEPKKAGGQPGIRLVSDEEAVGRLRAAVDARNEMDPDFVIVARTDGYDAEGGSLEEAIRRGRLYMEETGVDAIFYEGLSTWDEIRTAIAETPGPAFALGGHRSQRPSMAEIADMQQRITAVGFVGPGLSEVWKLLAEVKESGDLTPVDEHQALVASREGTPLHMGHIGDGFGRPSYLDVRRMEEKYLPESMQRGYADSPE